ncbi:MAG: hypothetical protein LBJ97_01055 [Mycoplasmataceae bacterium]|jgi:hypothetical protein|nr:hypothetical protein [Mycoplasmataceae bacterium]
MDNNKKFKILLGTLVPISSLAFAGAGIGIGYVLFNKSNKGGGDEYFEYGNNLIAEFKGNVEKNDYYNDELVNDCAWFSHIIIYDFHNEIIPASSLQFTLNTSEFDISEFNKHPSQTLPVTIDATYKYDFVNQKSLFYEDNNLGGVYFLGLNKMFLQSHCQENDSKLFGMFSLTNQMYVVDVNISYLGEDNYFHLPFSNPWFEDKAINYDNANKPSSS